jgi:hypothetical protein
MTSTPARCRAAIWSASAAMRSVSSVPSARVSTLLPTFTTMRRKRQRAAFGAMSGFSMMFIG